MIAAGATSPLAHWESYYVIVGTSAAALTGLQFVIMAIVADSKSEAGLTEVSAFGTPTVVHFTTVLLISAIVSAPWTALAAPAYTLLASGLTGLAYCTIVTFRARRATKYKAVLEDWIWHVIIPFVAYTTLLVSAALLRRHAEDALFGVGAASLILLFVGIHNAWDTVTYIALGQLNRARAPEPAPDHQPL